jgi:hypothetical protein
VADPSELQVALSTISADADEWAILLDPEVSPDAVAEPVHWKEGQAVACMSKRDGLVMYVLESSNEIRRTVIGPLMGAVVSDKRFVTGNPMQGRALITTEPRLEHPLVFDVSKRKEDRVERIREALLSLAR